MMRWNRLTPVAVLAAAASTAVLVAACGGLGAESRDAVHCRRAWSRRRPTNGATPMFLATPRRRAGRGLGVRAGGGLRRQPAPLGDAAPARPSRCRRSRCAIRWAPSRRTARHRRSSPPMRGGISVLYAVGKEMPGERFPRSALRFIRSTDSGRTWSEPRDGQRRHRVRLAQFPCAHRGAGRLVARHLARCAEGEVRRLDEPLHRRRQDLGGRIGRSTPIRPALLPDLRRGRRGRHHLRRLARDPARRRPRCGGHPLVRRRQDLERRRFASRCGRLGLSGLPSRGPLARGGRQGRVHVAWWTGKEGEAGVYYARSTDGGRPSPRSRSRPASRRGRRTCSSRSRVTGVYLAWDDGLGEMPRVLLRRSADGGEALRSPKSCSAIPGWRRAFPVLAVYGDSVAVAWSQTTAAEHRAKLAAMVDMKDPKAVMPLPRVGQSEILLRAGAMIACHPERSEGSCRLRCRRKILRSLRSGLTALGAPHPSPLASRPDAHPNPPPRRSRARPHAGAHGHRDRRARARHRRAGARRDPAPRRRARRPAQAPHRPVRRRPTSPAASSTSRSTATISRPSGPGPWSARPASPTSTARPWSSWTMCSTPAAPCARRSTSAPTSAARAGSCSAS